MSDDKTIALQSRSSLFVMQNKTLTLFSGSLPYASMSDFTLSRGQVVDDKYKILSVLGEGGMGAVYHAHHNLLDKTVALKTFKTLDCDEQTIMRFQREARALAKLSNVNIVQVFDYGFTAEKIPYYTMEYLEGESLGDLIKREGKLSIARAVGIFLQVCNGLSAAHLKGILHRDLKPSNIFLEKSNAAESKVRLVDFGLATMGAGDADQSGQTMAGVICGSPLYMSPEQARGEVLGPTSDVYSLGCTLFEALTGTPPIVGTNALHTMMLREGQAAPTLAQKDGNATFSAELEKIVATMLQRHPDDRQQSIELVVDDLQYLVRSRRKASVSVKEPAPQIVKSQRNSIALGLTAISALVMMAGAFYLYFHGTPMPKLLNYSAGQSANISPSPSASRQEVQSAAPDPALVCDRFVLKGQPYCRIKWPGHEIGQLKDGGPELRVDELSWKDDVTSRVILSKEFCSNIENFRVLQTIPVRGIQLNHAFDRKDFDKLLDIICHQPKLFYLGFEQQPLKDEDLKRLYSLPELRDLYIAECPTSGEALLAFAKKQGLNFIAFNHGQNYQALISGLGGNRRLYRLSVTDNKLSSDDVKNIATIDALLSLNLNTTGIGDEDIKSLLSLRHLYFVDLHNNKLTPRCIPTLLKWSEIVKSTGETHPFEANLSPNESWQDSDIERFKKLLPKCKIRGNALQRDPRVSAEAIDNLFGGEN